MLDLTADGNVVYVTVSTATGQEIRAYRQALGSDLWLLSRIM